MTRSGRRWSSRIRETWRSVLSWMHWRRRRLHRELEKREQLLDAIQLLLAAQRHRMLEDVQTLMLEAMSPMAEAMQRQDSLLRTEMEDVQTMLMRHQDETRDLLTEVLQTVQPNPDQVIRTRVGLPRGESTPTPSSINSAISAMR